jgi:hypothetical protein
MCRIVSVIVCVLTLGFYAGLNAQIPESVQFQPGTFMVPYRQVQRPQAVDYSVVNPTYSMGETSMEEAIDALENDEEESDDSTTEWEKKFSPQTFLPPPPLPLLLPPYEVPHLTFVYNRWTGRFHIAPYEPGYAANPAAFPKQTSPLHIWISSKSSASQLSPQVPYMSYYDPDPVILPAEIRLYGSRIAAEIVRQPQIQPIPWPIPKPAMAQPVAPPARTRIGERMRQSGTFYIPRPR